MEFITSVYFSWHYYTIIIVVAGNEASSRMTCCSGGWSGESGLAVATAGTSTRMKVADLSVACLNVSDMVFAMGRRGDPFRNKHLKWGLFSSVLNYATKTDGKVTRVVALNSRNSVDSCLKLFLRQV